MKSQLRVADARKFDTHPATYTHVRWPVKLFRVSFDQHLLASDCGRYRERNVPIVVMVNGAHRKHPLDKERRFAMRELFCSAGQRETNPPDALDMFFALVRLSLFGCWFQGVFLIFHPSPDEVSTGSGSDWVANAHHDPRSEDETRSLPRLCQNSILVTIKVRLKRKGRKVLCKGRKEKPSF